MDKELRKGNVILLKKPLADLVGIVQWVAGEDIGIRHIDGAPGENCTIRASDVIKLADEFTRELPPDVQGAIEKQREIVFAPPKREPGKKKEKLTIPVNIMRDLLQIIEEDKQAREKGGTDNE